MADFKKYPSGKDGENEPGMEINGVYYTLTQILIATDKALIKKGVLTKTEIAAEL